jgi:AbrB family looped-hinge helix DNA binding protein
MRITSKGQVTIPQDIRERAGLVPGTEVEFHYDGKAVLVRKSKFKRGARGEEIVRRLRGKGTVKMTTDEIIRLMRGE